MVPGPGPRRDENHETRPLAFLGDMGPYWFYVFIVLLLFIGLGLVTVLALYYIQQQGSLALHVTSTPLALSPRIAVEPTSGPPGTLLRVTAQGWAAGDVVFVSLEAPFAAVKRDFAYAGAVVGEDGRFHVNFTFPEDAQWAGAGAVKIVAWAEQSGAKSVTIFQVESGALPVSIASTEELAFTGQAGSTPQPASDRVSIAAFLPEPTATALPSLPATNWYGEYFDNATLSGIPLFFRDYRQLDFDWGDGSPAAALEPDQFSVRWSRYVPFAAGVYRFFAQADDGVRLWVDDRLVIDQWHRGASTTYVADTYLWDGPHLVRLEYYEDEEHAAVRLWWDRLEVFPDWKGEYFSNAALQGEPAQVRNDPQIRFIWGDESPVQGIRGRDFSVRWTRRIAFARGRYRFYVNANTGMRVWLDSNLALDFWQNAGAGLRTTDLSLDEGEYSVRVEYFNRGGNARAEFHWEQLVATPLSPALLPQTFASVTSTPAPPLRSDQVEQAQLIMKAQAIPSNAHGETPPAAESEPNAWELPAATLVTIQDVERPNRSEVSDATTLSLPASRAELQVDPAAVPLGGQVNVKGAGWKPGDEVTVSLVEPGGDLTQAPPYATVLVDDFGQFNVQLLVPDDPKWVDYSELIVLAHSADWTVRLVTPLTIRSSASVEILNSPLQP